MDFKKTTWMDLEGIMLSEVSWRKTNAVWFHLYVESKSKLMHICNKREIVTEAENKEVVDRGKETGGGKK